MILRKEVPEGLKLKIKKKEARREVRKD